MSDFNSSLVIPSLTTHVQRGGGPSLLYIEIEDDYSDVVTSAEWNMMAMFQNSNFNQTPPGTQDQDLNLTLIDGDKYTLPDQGIDESPDAQERTFQVVMTDLTILNLMHSVKSKRFFFVYPVKFVGTTKYVEFGYGMFKRDFSYVQDWGQFLVFNVGIKYKPTLLSSTPTFPVLPTNIDALFTTDEANKKYLGWLLASADAASGGFGNAVAMPDFTDLPGTRPSVVLEA